MALTKLSFDEARKIRINNIIISLKEFGCSLYVESYNYLDVMKKLYSLGLITSISLKEHIRFKYGNPDDENEIEWLLVNIIELNNFVQHISIMFFRVGVHIDCEKNIKLLHNSTKQVIEKYFIEYDVQIDGNGYIIKYTPKETKTIIDNIKDVPKKIANPIKELLKPNIKETEIVGLISMTYKDFEKVKSESLINLNATDQNIYKNIWNLAKQLANNIDGAKGHNGKSLLSLKDIAHNYALNVSLIQKLIQMNEQ